MSKGSSQVTTVGRSAKVVRVQRGCLGGRGRHQRAIRKWTRRGWTYRDSVVRSGYTDLIFDRN